MQLLRIIKKTVLGLIILLSGSCSLFMEEDISDDTIEIISPGDQVSTEIVTQTFWWKLNPDASSYRLQVVEPSFALAEALLLDTLVSEDKYEFTLYAGEFEWRVRGENGAYQTDWTFSSLTVVATDDLTKQKVRLRSPIENYFTKQTELIFKWDTLPNTDSYVMRHYTGAWGQDMMLDSINIVPSSLKLTMEEGELWWGIQAVNEFSESGFNYQRLVVDLTIPNRPSLLEPENNASFSDKEVDFSWESSDPVWSEVKDSLLIYEKLDNTNYQLYKTLLSGSKSISVELESGKNYGWVVKSIDKAGNVGEESERRDFAISN